MSESVRFQQILGIRFFVGRAQDAIDEISQKGGLVVVPAAPALWRLEGDTQYREALLGADFAIADSSLMVWLWNILQRDGIPKLSGLLYLRALVAHPEFGKPSETFWVMPTPAAARCNVAWLRENGVSVADDDLYLAPMYGKKFEDPELVRRLAERRPKHVILCVGGGTQEPLGLYLKKNLPYQPAIHCIGAAIAFLSGNQVSIPVWVDKMGLGWLLRVLSAPKSYGRRYWEARRLIPLILCYRDRLPPFRACTG